MAAYQELNIIGNCGGEVTARYTPTGQLVGNFSVAVNQSKKVGEEYKNEMMWVRVTIWGDRAETAKKKITKGTEVFVSGRLNFDAETHAPRIWESEGKPQTAFEMTADKIVYLARTATAKAENDDFSD